MDARQHDDLIYTIVQALMDARYEAPKRRRSAWHEGYDEDLEQARRVAAAIVEALRRSGFQGVWITLVSFTRATSARRGNPQGAHRPEVQA
jgi:hypothetical protein